MMLKLTPTQQRLYDALGDGEPHSAKELLLLLDEEPGQAESQTLYVHIYQLKLKLRGTGEEVISQATAKGNGYRRMLHLNQAINALDMGT